MGVLRKAGFFVLVLAAILGGVWGYFALKKSRGPARPASVHLPEGAFFYAESSDFFALHKDITSRSLAVDELRAIPLINDACLAMEELDSVAAILPSIAEQIREHTLHFALYPDGAWVICFNLSNESVAADCVRELGEKLESRMINGTYSFYLPAAGDEIFAALHEGALCVSSSALKLKECLSDSPRMVDQAQYRKFREKYPLPGKCTIMIDHEVAVEGKLRNMQYFSLTARKGITIAEVNAGTSEITLNGFENGPAVSYDQFSTKTLVEALPASCTRFEGRVMDSTQLRRNLPANEAFWKNAADTALFDVKGAFYKNLGEVVVNAEFAGAEMLLVAVRDSAGAREQLRFMSDSMRAGRVYRLREPVSLLSAFNTRAGWAAVQGTWLMLFSEAEQGDRATAMLEQGELLASSRAFEEYYQENIVEQFSTLFWCEPQSCTPFLASRLQTPEREIDSAFAGFRFLSFSRSAGSEGRVRLHMQYTGTAPKKEEGSAAPSGLQPLWTVSTEHGIVRKPALFRNHNNQENEILCQDSAGTLYLVSAKGSLIWKREIGSSALSEFYMVDAFRNNKYQILFNTAEAIYLIDRNGKDVEGFPVKLRSKATSGMSLFDYDKNLNYRILVSCSDRRIYNYGIDGREQATWVKPNTEAIVELPVQYVNAGGSEFLVILDQAGKLYLLNRRGQPRVELVNRALSGCRAFYADAGAGQGDSYVFYADERDAQLHRISFTDQKTIIDLDRDFRNGRAYFRKADNNRFMDLVVIKGDKAAAYDLAGNRIGTIAFRQDVSSVEHVPDKQSALAFSAPHGKVLVLQDGAVREFEASSPALRCDLFHHKSWYLLFGSGNKLVCVKQP